MDEMPRKKTRAPRAKPGKAGVMGRPPLLGQPLDEVRGLGLPASTWRALDEEAHRETLARGSKITWADIVRRKLGLRRRA